MKRSSITILSALLCVCLLLAGCIQPDDNGNGTNDGLRGPEDLHVYKNTVYTYSTDVDETLLTTELSPAYLVLANKSTTLAPTYEPSQLRQIDNRYVASWHTGTGLYLEARAMQALTEMLRAMQADGVTDVKVTSAFRTYARQADLFAGYVSEEMKGFSNEAYAVLGEEYIQTVYLAKKKTGLGREDAERVALSYSARPGTSEHQTGLCVDFITDTMSGLNTTFETTEAFAWLRQNAYQFGFILRYPKEKVDITGYTYEPWHYRFVGREAATDIYFSGLSLEEYLTALA